MRAFIAGHTLESSKKAYELAARLCCRDGAPKYVTKCFEGFYVTDTKAGYPKAVQITPFIKGD